MELASNTMNETQGPPILIGGEGLPPVEGTNLLTFSHQLDVTYSNFERSLAKSQRKRIPLAVEAIHH